MRAGTIPATERAGTASFELERFELTAPDRLEVAGRWFGVRGLRFMRPALDLQASEDRHRLLALLEHKPWAAEDGEEWVAAFPWDGDPLEFTEAELAVGPSVAVELPLPGNGSRKSKPRKPPARSRGRTARVRVGAPRDRALAEARRLREERDTAVEARDAAVTERDAALAERDALLAERDAARAERDPALASRDAGLRERDAALRE